MPYGIAKSQGGDTPTNDQRLLDCKQAVMAKGTSELSAILICKSRLFPKNGRPTKGR